MKCTPNTFRQNVYLGIAFVVVTAALTALAKFVH
jgi:hypothetical protein